MRAAFDLSQGGQFEVGQCKISDLDSAIPEVYADSVRCLLYEELSDTWYCGLQHHRILKLQKGAVRMCVTVQQPPTKL